MGKIRKDLDLRLVGGAYVGGHSAGEEEIVSSIFACK